MRERRWQTGVLGIGEGKRFRGVRDRGVSDDTRHLNAEAGEGRRVCISSLSSPECRQDAAHCNGTALSVTRFPEFVRAHAVCLSSTLFPCRNFHAPRNETARINDDAAFSRVAIAEIVRRARKLISIREISSYSSTETKTPSSQSRIIRGIFIHIDF